ncbi:hypothetical protein F5B20DRAFT_543945 [Whalleya microplaca]|nr:hypothetical protein F5B20DRAFT_543945 [Whalleya microplaca]
MGESVGDLASSGSEYDNMNNIDIATLPQDFILAFSEIYPPIEAGFQKFAEATNHDQILSEVVQKLRGSLLHTDDSIDIIAYHRLSFEFGRAIGKLHESNSETQGQVQDQSDDEAAFKLEITNQPWYQDLNEQSEVYKCVWSCFYWCRDQLLSRPHRSEALLDFDTLGLPDTGDELNTFKQDACLFTYLFDLWFSQMFTTPLPWTQLSKRALRIPPTIMLHTMSSLILTWAGKSLPQQHRSSQSSSWDFNALLDFVQSGVGSIEEKCKMKRLIVEFISEFVFIHELPGEEDSDEEQKVQKFEEQRARIIAEEYIKQRFPVVEFPFVDSTGVDPLWDSDTFGFNGIMEV